MWAHYHRLLKFLTRGYQPRNPSPLSETDERYNLQLIFVWVREIL
jgi:hypothetical protein